MNAPKIYQTFAICKKTRSARISSASGRFSRIAAKAAVEVLRFAYVVQLQFYSHRLRDCARVARPNLIFSQLYSSYQIVTASRVWHLSASSLCSVIAVDVCVTEALEPRFFCHLLISNSNSPISLLPST